MRLPSGADAECALAVPFALLDAVEGTDPASASIVAESSGKVRARWTDRGQSREAVFEAVPVDAVPAPPASRPRVRPVDASFLLALHECGRTTAREGVRYAFSQLQLKEGQVIATDGQQLLVWKGFDLPFVDSVLVPAIPAFGNRELAAQDAVRIGKAGSQVLVEAGPWTVGLTIDEGAKFPEVESLLRRSGGGACLRIAERDAEAILLRLGRDLVRAENPQPITLGFGPRPEVVLGAMRIPLAVSESTGTPTTAAVQVAHLKRALQLGLRSVRTDRAGATVLFEDERRSYLVTVASPESAAPAGPSPATVPCTTIRTISQEGGPSMPSSKNGHATTDPGDGEEVLDPIAEAEAVKAALGEAGRRVGRLIASLRQIHKQRRVLLTAWTSLKQLGLGAREEP